MSRICAGIEPIFVSLNNVSTINSASRHGKDVLTYHAYLCSSEHAG